MFAEQRQEKILEFLREFNQVDVSSLTMELSASEATIRRDLEKLERMGLLHRTHGGAILARESAPFLQIAASYSKPEMQEINDIGRAAARFLSDDEVVGIGSGELGLSLARNIDPNIRCTIVTNDVMVMTELLNHRNIEVLMVGGLARKRSENCIFTSGESTVRTMDELHLDKVFLCVDGVDFQNGYTTKDFEYALIWKKFKDISRQVIVIAAADSFDRKNFVKLAAINEVQQVISSVKLDDRYKKFYFENGISIHIGHEI